MSTFDGVIREYNGVIVDQFCAQNCRNGQAFFLSHCHKDHMKNLTSTELTATLRSGGAKGLFCSVATRDLLQADPDFEHLRHFMVGLAVDEPVVLKLANHTDDQNAKAIDLEFTVTLIPAGHCPGSVMFLFEGPNGNVLYTGDFRVSIGETPNLSSLQTCGGSLKTIDSVYVDSTFCHPAAAHIPPRSLSRKVVLERTGRWLAKGEGHYVCVRAPTFGYEHVWMALYEEFDMPIHVSDRVYGYYSRSLPEVARCLTTDPAETRIHSCKWDSSITSSFRSYLPCGYVPSSGTPAIYRIRMSIMGFVRNNSIPTCGYVEYENSIHVVHSMHASYNEIRDLVKSLRPRAVHACVNPAVPKAVGVGCIEDVGERLKDLLCGSSSDSTSEDANSNGRNESAASLKRQASWPSRKPLHEETEPKSLLLSSVAVTASICSGSESQAHPAVMSRLGDPDEDQALPMPPKRRRRA